LKTFFLYWNTIRYLKPIQVFGRIWFHLYKPKAVSQKALSRNYAKGYWQAVPTKPKSLTGFQTFTFLNVEGKLKDITWQAPVMSKLWRYNLHYFDYLLSDLKNYNQGEVHLLLTDWIEKNNQFQGEAWDPYPTSLRIVNWIKWSIQGNEIDVDCLQNLAIQSRWLSKRLERHMKGNHLLANAKALIFAGLYFKGAEAKKWLQLGVKIIDLELDEQILQDGGHFERSTVYHAVVLEDILDVINIFSYYNPSFKTSGNLVDKLKLKAEQMFGWLRFMTHPDGEISYFNDAALGACPGLGILSKYAERLGIGLPVHRSTNNMELKESGFCRLANDNFTAILDIGPIGASYLAGHAHADTLSFEMSFQDQRIIVNGGTSTYEDNQQRLFERGTKSHSTLTLEDMDSSEVWGAFRVARRANIVEKKCEVDGDLKTASASHDGYINRLPGNPVHQRAWELTGDQLLVSDQVQSSSQNEGLARFIFHPDIKINVLKDSKLWSLEIGHQCLLYAEVLVGEGKIGTTTFAKAFGEVHKTLSLDVFLKAGKATTRFFVRK
jgi:uncharacterized heparinase superfamily protein